MRTLIMLALLASAPLSATPAGPEEQAEDRQEARAIVRKAYAAAREYCARYPNASQAVTVMDDGIEIEIRVRCEVVNRYFDGKIRQ